MGTKLLVIDDDPNICDLLRYFFENEGYEVKTAGDGVEGISFFKMYEPDLVLLDLMLPKNKDGNQVCREIRAISSKPVIMITDVGLDIGPHDPIGCELLQRLAALLLRFAGGDAQREAVLAEPL